MNQRVPDELISAYFDGEVTSDERLRVERLLESSTELRQVLEDTSKLSALLHSFPREAAPAELAANVRRQIESVVLTVPAPALAKRQGLRREWTAFAAGMMATVASLFLYVAFNPSPNGPRHGGLAHSNRPAVVARENSLVAARDHVEFKTPRDWTLGAQPEVALHAPGAPGLSAAKNASPEVATVNSPIQTETSTIASSRSVLSSAVSENLKAPAKTANESSSVQLLAQQPSGVAGDLGGEIMLLPQAKEEFLQSLKKGDVIVQHIADPDNTVMVVELVVVDIDKGVEGMHLILQKRDLRQIENGEALGKSGRSSVARAAPGQASKKSAAAEDLVVIYVRASGAQLADALSDSVKLHPEIYRELAPRLPFELPLNEVSNSANVAASDGIAGAGAASVASEGIKTAIDQQAVAVEASLVVHSFASLNGMSVDDSLNGNLDLKQTQARMAQIKAGAIASKGGSNSVSVRVANTEDQSLTSTQKDLDKRDAKTDKAAQQIGNSSQGYAAFRVAVDNQRPLAEQQLLPRQSIAPTFQYNQLGANSVLLGAGSSQQRQTRSNLDNRDPRLMRMLIVLKTEQIAPHP